VCLRSSKQDDVTKPMEEEGTTRGLLPENQKPKPEMEKQKKQEP
jgi:hypothetical protein